MESLSKRSKGSNIQTNSVSCLVDACNVDLTHCREYHRRHKVCERHSKARTVSIGGLNHRFCQQCSRFHTLAEFDEVKRSCRKRLDGHNRRRRKSKMDPGPLISTQQVVGSTRMFSLNSLQLNPSTFMAKSESPIEPFSNHLVHLPLNHSYQESSSSSAANKGGSDHFLYFQREAPLATTNADHALSLLSLPPLLSQRTPVTIQPVPCGLDQYAFIQQMDHEAGFCDFNRNNNDTNLQLEGMFHDERGGSPPIGTQQQTLPFQWFSL